MNERLTEDTLCEIANGFGATPTAFRVQEMATELIALRAAWKIAEPHLLYPIRRRCLAVLADAPQ